MRNYAFQKVVLKISAKTTSCANRQNSLYNKIFVCLFTKPCPLNLIPSGYPPHLICIPSLIIDFLFNHTLLPYSISYVSAVLTKPNKFRLYESSVKTDSYFDVGFEIILSFTRKSKTNFSYIMLL